jgi:hypothetical protein
MMMPPRSHVDDSYRNVTEAGHVHGPPRGGEERILDPIDRTSEVLFGLIMALTFTSTFSAATAGPEDTRVLLYGAIGCNVAWGLVDAVMFLMRSITERGHGLQTIRAVHAASGREEAYGIIIDVLPPAVASLLTRDTLERVRLGLLRMDDLPAAPSSTREDWFGAAAVFCWYVFRRCQS